MRKENEESGKSQTFRVRKGVRCLCCSVTVDAIEHYKTIIHQKKEAIRAELKLEKTRNSGRAVLVFQDARVIQDFKHFGADSFHKLIT